MPDSWFHSKIKKEEGLISNQSALTSVVEIMNFRYFHDLDKFHELNLFYEELAQEISYSRQKNYRFGFRVIEPEIVIISDKIYLFSRLFLEKNLPELSSMAFKLFVEYCNMILAVGFHHEIALRGFAGIDQGYRMTASSGGPARSTSKENLVLSDMLKVFHFDEIFPEGVGQALIPPARIPVMHSYRVLNSQKFLEEIPAVGIYFPESLRNFPLAEISIFSDMLSEVNLSGKKLFAANWQNWADSHPENFPMEEIKASLKRQVESSESGLGSFWKNYIEVCCPDQHS